MQKTLFIIFLCFGVLTTAVANEQSDSSSPAARNDDAQIEEKIRRDLQNQKSKKADSTKQGHGQAWNYLLNAPEPSNTMQKRWNKKVQVGGDGYKKPSSVFP